jgi:hypothetical protein
MNRLEKVPTAGKNHPTSAPKSIAISTWRAVSYLRLVSSERVQFRMRFRGASAETG